MGNPTMAHTSKWNDDEARWQAVCRRDPEADGRFWFAVRTTGIFCRPSCPSRRAKRENVSFFEHPDSAAAAGFRPCKRCRPDRKSREEELAEVVAAACRRLETSEEEPTLAELAKRAGLSPFHFHRLFKERVGITPKQYATACRHRRVRQELQRQARVTDAIYEAGYGSGSRFYESSQQVLGMAPRAFARGGRGEVVRYGVRGCRLGHVLVAATERGICSITFGDDPAALERGLLQAFPGALNEESPELARGLERVLEHLDRPERRLDLPLDIRGTSFQHQVWEALRQIPVGRTASYGEVARSLGRPGSARAVARACAANPVALAVPCHRVVRADGEAGGYRWGEGRKRKLLSAEGLAARWTVGERGGVEEESDAEADRQSEAQEPAGRHDRETGPDAQ